MMGEIRNTWELIDSNKISIRARYIRSSINVWADNLSRETYMDDWQMNSRVFDYPD
jgi:hypothetical protein